MYDSPAGGCCGGGVLTFLVSLRLISYLSNRRSASFLAVERRDIPGVNATAAPPSPPTPTGRLIVSQRHPDHDVLTDTNTYRI